MADKLYAEFMSMINTCALYAFGGYLIIKLIDLAITIVDIYKKGKDK